MFYYINASSVTLNPGEFEKLITTVIGESAATMIVGLYAIERLIRINPKLVDVTNLSRYFNLLLESAKNSLLNQVSLRLIAISLENYK